MTHEQRRQWRRHVLRLGKETLTATQKNVLMALETYADYRDGANAFPGHERLAEDCDITTRAVTIAITRGRELGLIEQTSPANPKAGRAAVYRIVPVDVSTGTAVPVNDSIGGTVVPLLRPIGGTGVPVENSIGGTATTPSVERPFLPPESFTRTTGVVTNSGTSPEPLDLNHPPLDTAINTPTDTQTSATTAAKPGSTSKPGKLQPPSATWRSPPPTTSLGVVADR